MLNRCRMLLAAAVTAMLVGGVSAFAASPAHRPLPSRSVAPTITLAFPAQGAEVSRSRPPFSGTALGDSRRVRVKLWQGRARRGHPYRILTTRRSGSSYAVRPAHRLRAGIYTARAKTWRPGAGGKTGRSNEIPTFKVKRGGRDLTAPETTITSGPSGTITTGSASFAFSSSETGSSFQCKLDSAAWAACTSPKSYAGLAAGAHTFSVRANGATGNTDASPASRSFSVGTTPASGGPPAGTIVQADYVNRACPIDDLWGSVMSAHFSETRCASWSDSDDPQVDHFATGGYPLPALDGQVHPGYRRMRLTDGRQSIYDAGVGNASYRTQLISNSNTRTYYPIQPGHRYVWWISIRFQNSTPLSGDRASDDSQVWQIKNTGDCAGPDEVGPIVAMTETENRILLKQRQRDYDVRIDSFPIGQRGAWQMYALDVLYSNDPSKAAYRLWADQDGDSARDLEPLTSKITGRVTAVGPSCIGKPSIGPYQPMSIPATSRDYGVNEFVEVPVGAPWE